MTWRQGRRIEKHLADCRCGHPHLCHYTQERNCAFKGCECKEFKGAGREEFRNIKKAKCEYGHPHNSGLEIKTCFELHCLKLAHQIRAFEAEKVLELPGPSGKTVAHYKLDFIVYHMDGTTEFIECKGKHLERKGDWRIKWALLQDRHKGDPKYTFRVVNG